MQAYLRMRYNERLTELEDVIPPLARERLEADLDELLAGEAIDFSYLPAQMQLTVLGDLREEGFGALVRAMNGEVVSAIAHVPAATPPDRETDIARLLGYEAYAHAFGELWDRSHDAATAEGAARYEGVQDALAEAFARIGQIRLLLGPLDHDPHAE